MKHRTFNFFIANVLLLSLTACLYQGSVDRVHYNCNNGMRFSAAYQENALILTIDGNSRSMYRVPSASGTKFATEQGLSQGNGLIFWTKGNEATLYEMILDDSVSAQDYPEIIQCRIP